MQLLSFFGLPEISLDNYTSNNKIINMTFCARLPRTLQFANYKDMKGHFGPNGIEFSLYIFPRASNAKLNTRTPPDFNDWWCILSYVYERTHGIRPCRGAGGSRRVHHEERSRKFWFRNPPPPLQDGWKRHFPAGAMSRLYQDLK